MTPNVEQICQWIAEHHLASSADLARLRTRWFQPKRTDANDVDKFGQWLSVNGYLTPFAFRMLRNGKADLLQLNQYQLTDHLVSGPFAGAYLALDPLRRPVVLEVLAADRAANLDAVKAFHIAAEKARSVNHANVIATLDFGEAKGRHYLIREFGDGETLADILARRGRLQPISAARLFALALMGLHALHENQVPVGPLGAESLLVAVAGKTAANKARTVKILNAGVPRSLFDPAALDAVITAAAPMAGSDSATLSEPREELFRLGISFYRSLTGQMPFPAESAAPAMHRATPIRQIAPEVPELLAQTVESMLDANAANRPASAARVAKSLRVFLASEEETHRSPPEDHLLQQPQAFGATLDPEGTAAAPAPVESEVGEQRSKEGELTKQLQTLWTELKPSVRDWVFFSIGVAAVILTVLFLNLVTGIHFVNLVCLLAGGALSFFVERLLRWREVQAE
jgi:serine/threonine protein kinase